MLGLLWAFPLFVSHKQRGQLWVGASEFLLEPIRLPQTSRPRVFRSALNTIGLRPMKRRVGDVSPACDHGETTKEQRGGHGQGDCRSRALGCLGRGNQRLGRAVELDLFDLGGGDARSHGFGLRGSPVGLVVPVPPKASNDQLCFPRATPTDSSLGKRHGGRVHSARTRTEGLGPIRADRRDNRSSLAREAAGLGLVSVREADAARFSTARPCGGEEGRSPS